MKEEVNYWLATIPISVAALAWALNQFSTVLTLRLADRRILRETIYFLLELRHLFRAATQLRDPAKYASIYFEALQHRLPGITFTTTERAQFTEVIAQLLHKMEANLANDTSPPEGYAAALLKLASVDPLNAYRLRGKDSLLSLVGDLGENTREVLAQQENLRVDADPMRIHRMHQVTKRVQPHTDALLIKAALVEIEDVLADIARKVGWREHRKLQELLLESDTANDIAIQKAMREGVDKLVEAIEQQYNEEHPST
jgi:hypothetical protein